MAEPTATATATLIMAGAAIPALTAFGVPLGLRVDVLLAGFWGAIAAIALLNSVPSTGDTWRELLRTTLRRCFVAVASAVTAGYLAPFALPDHLTVATLLGTSFVIGAGAQQALALAMTRFAKKGGDQP
jgi:hypothetical protein